MNNGGAVLANTYFGYVLSQCIGNDIENICSVISTRAELINKGKEKFNGSGNITADWRLFDALIEFVNNPIIFNPNLFGEDTRKIYKRCISITYSFEEFNNYERVFEKLFHLNWILASNNNARDLEAKQVVLLSDPDVIKKSLRKYLQGVYNTAIQDENEIKYIDEAIQAKGKIFQGLFPFQFEESRKYLSYDYLELKRKKEDYIERSKNEMALFYGLTATAARTDDIWRYTR